MLKMPMQLDKVSIKSNATQQIKIWDHEAKEERRLAKNGEINPPKYPWENRESSLNQFTKIKHANE
jgi:hypothetical protein